VSQSRSPRSPSDPRRRGQWSSRWRMALLTIRNSDTFLDGDLVRLELHPTYDCLSVEAERIPDGLIGLFEHSVIVLQAKGHGRFVVVGGALPYLVLRSRTGLRSASARVVVIPHNADADWVRGRLLYDLVNPWLLALVARPATCDRPANPRAAFASLAAEQLGLAPRDLRRVMGLRPGGAIYHYIRSRRARSGKLSDPTGMQK
jgi:hypothetical protein